MAAVKVGIIGGGSAYAPSIVKSFIENSSQFEGSEIVLMDLVPEHLEIVGALTKKMAEAYGANLKIRTTTNREEALDSSDFVITTFRTGGYKQYHLDEVIPLKYGILGQETTGPGGMMFAFRTIPVMLDIADEMERLCPSAWIINYANPTNIVTAAVQRRSGIKILGLCDEPVGELYFMSKMLNVDHRKLRGISYGLNHAFWFTKIFYEGIDMMPKLREIIDNVKEEDLPYKPLKYSFRLFKIFGIIPTIYLRYYYFNDEMLEIARSSNKTRAQEIEEEVPKFMNMFKNETEKTVPDPIIFAADAVLHNPIGMKNSPHGDFAVNVINCIANDTEKIIVLNVPNMGSISNFNRNTIVEVPTVLSKNGAFPLHMGPLPKEVGGLIEAIGNYEELVVTAALEGSSRSALKALMAHPLVHSAQVAEKLLDEMLKANKKYLPQFKGRKRNDCRNEN